MITIPRPSFDVESLLHLLLISPIVIPGVSSIYIWVSASWLIPSLNFLQSLLSSFPVLSLEPSICATDANIRFTNCSAFISRLNNATALSVVLAIFVATFKANAVLPIAGRAAIIINSFSCSPLVNLSIS